MKNLKKTLALTLAFTLAVGATACGSSNNSADSSDKASSGKEVYRTLDEIKESGEINIGVFSDKNPFGYVDENGEYQGYDIYFANRLGEDLGVDVNFVSTEAANRIEYLQTGKVDVILANTRQVLSSEIAEDMKKFLSEIADETVDLKSLGIRGTDKKKMTEMLYQCYGLKDNT